MLTGVEAALTVVVPATWLVLLVALIGTKVGRDYWATPTRESAIPDQINTQGQQLAVAALVFAGLALVSPDPQLGRLSDLLLVALACFVMAWLVGFWADVFTSQLAGDWLLWTGIACFLAATYEFAVNRLPGTMGRWAVLLALLGTAVLSGRAAYTHWRVARAFAQLASSS